jgi:Sulfatase
VFTFFQCQVSQHRTRSIGSLLPAPLGAVINLNAYQSKPYWAPRVVPPKGAPNVLLIMTDDARYGISGTFGDVIPTPALDRIAQMGLRYKRFHSTALCSPTRAAPNMAIEDGTTASSPGRLTAGRAHYMNVHVNKDGQTGYFCGGFQPEVSLWVMRSNSIIPVTIIDSRLVEYARYS